jgi:hypothetical protein
MGNPTPRLQDLPGLFDQGPMFRPGDRILVCVRGKLHHEEHHKLKRAVEKFACCPVRIFIIDPHECRMVIVRKGERLVLADPSQAGIPTTPGIASVSCRKVEFREGDQLYLVRQATWSPELIKYAKERAGRWAGDGVEVFDRHLVV